MTPTAFKQAFPAFATLPDELIAQVIARGVAHFDARRWGGFYEEGLGLWVANRLVLRTQETHESDHLYNQLSLGRLQLKQDKTTTLQQCLDPSLRTLYGQQLHALKKKINLGALVL